MDLSELKFKVDTTELVSAETAVKKLGDAVDGLAKPIGELNTQAKRLGKSAEAAGKSVNESLTKPAEEAGDSLSKVEKMIQKAGLSLAVLRNQAIDTADGTFAVVDSFTKMQAGMLATAKMAGATSSQMQELANIIKQTNDITGQNPFDKSASGLAKMKQEVQELTAIMALQAQGLALTGKELQEYSRDITRVTAAMQAEGKSSEELSAALSKLKNETLQLSAEKAKLVVASKAAEEQVKREAAAALERERAEQQSIETTRRNFNYRMQFIEEQKQAEKKAYAESMQEMRKYYAEQERATRAAEDEITRQQQAREKALIQQSYIAQGNSAGASGRAASMQMQGVSREVIDSYLAQAKVLEGASAAARKHATAVRYLTDVESRLDAQLKDGKDLREKYTDRMVKVRNAIQASGVSADVAAEKLKNLESKIRAVASKERQEELDRLARGVSVQMGDVGISLASGMNPLLVMIQQGDQIRGLLQQTDATAAELKKTMSSAFTQIASSIVDTGKAIGGFFVGSLMDAGKAFAAFTTQLPVLGFASRELEKFRLKNQKLGEEGSAGYLAIANAIGVFQKAMLAVSTIPVVLAITAVTAAVVALVQAVKETDAFTRSMTLANGALGLTANNAALMAMSMNSAGISTGDAMKVMTAMGKTSELTSKQVQMVTKSAVDLKTYGGVAIEDTVKVFADLAKDPLDALFKVAKQTGQVSYESLRLVESLKMQGREQDAATAAMQIYADVTARQIEDMKTNYTAFGSFMIELGKGIKEFYNTIKDALFGLFVNPSDVERISEAGKKLAAVQTAINSGESNPVLSRILEVRKKELTDEIAGLNAKFALEQSMTEQRQRDIDLQKQAAKLREANLTKEQKYVKEIKTLVDQRNRANPEDQGAFDLQIAAEAKKYGEELEKAANKRERLTDVEKEANRLQNAAEAMMKRVTNQTNGSTAAIERMSAAQKLQLDIYADPDFLDQPARNKISIANLLNQAIATEQVANAEKDRAKAHDSVNASLRIANGVLGKSIDMGSEYYRVQDSMFDLLEKGAQIGVDYSDTVLKVLAALEKTTPAARLKASVENELNEIMLKQILTLNELQAARSAEAETMFMTTQGKERYNKIQEIELEAMRERLAVGQQLAKLGGDADDAQVAATLTALREIENKRKFKINVIDEDATLNSVNKTIDAVRQGLGDAIYTALTGKGTDAGKKLRQVLEDELIKKPFKVKIEAFVSDVFRNNLGKSTDQNSLVGSIVAMTKTFDDAFGNGSRSSLNGGSPFSDAMGFFQGGEYTKGAGTAIGAASTYGAYYGAGKSIGTSISNGYGALGSNSGNSAVNTGAAIGTIWGPVGTAIGAALGGVFNRLFGTKLSGTKISGNFSSQGFNGERVDSISGGYFRNDREERTKLDKDATREITKAYGDILKNIKGIGSAFGGDFSSTTLNNFGTVKEIDLTGLSQEDALKKFAEMLTEISDDMISNSFAIERYVREGERSSEALIRMHTSLTEVNRVFELMNKTLYASSLAGADMASQLVDSFGSVEDFNSAMEFFFDNFYTEEENLRLKTAALTREFADLGYTLPATRDEYLRLAEAQDLSTKQGRDVYSSLIKLSGAFAEITPQLDTLAGKFGTLIGTMFDDALEQINAQISASQRAADQARRVAQEYFDISDALREYANGLTGGSESSNYRSVLAAAQGGDIGAMQNLQGAAQDFIESARANSSSTEEYNQRVAQVQQELLQVAALAGTQGTAAEYQAQLLDINTELLEELKASIETQNVTVDLLNEQLAALELVGELITASANLTVAQSITNTGELKTGLVDNAGNVVASIDSTTAAQLAAIAAQTASVTSNGTASANTVASAIGSDSTAQLAAIAAQTSSVTANGTTNANSITGQLQVGTTSVTGAIGSESVAQLAAIAAQTNSVTANSTTNAAGISTSVTNAATGQTISFGNIIGGQTSAYAGLSADQIAALANVEEVGAENADYAAGIEALTNTNNAVLSAVLNSLDSDRTSFAQLIASVTSGNTSIRNVLNNILLQLQVNGNVEGANQGQVGGQQTEAQLLLAAAQALLVQIRDTALPGINSAQAEYDNFYNQVVAPAEAEAAATGDYRIVNQLYAQLAVYDTRLQELTATLDRDLEAQREIIRSLGGIPAFASGGMHSGGMRLVGENGPELEVTGPSRIFNASQTAAMLRGGDNSELLEVLISKVEMLEAAARSSAVSNNKVAKILDRVSPDGNSLQITTAV